MWKYFPTKLYKRYEKAEEDAYEIVQKMIVNLTKEGLRDDGSPMSTILHAEGLDEREKVSGVVGEFLLKTLQRVGSTSFELTCVNPTNQSGENVSKLYTVLKLTNEFDLFQIFSLPELTSYRQHC